MSKSDFRKRILSVLGTAPAIKEIFLSTDPIEIKRDKLRQVLIDILGATYGDDPEIPPLEWILVRDTISVLRSMLSIRNEKLADFSLLSYINDLVHDPSKKGLPKPSPGFLAELEHLFMGTTGNANIYDAKAPAFLKYGGRKASKMRSTDLSRMANAADKFMNRYASGLDEDVIRRRMQNRMRILKHFNATDLEWGD